MVMGDYMKGGISRFGKGWMAAAVLALAAPLSAGANVIYDTDFSQINEWAFSGNNTTSVTAAPDGDGTAARFVLNRNDPVSFRSELVHISGMVPNNVRNASPGQEYWYGFKVWLDKFDRDTEDDILFQFHGAADAGCPSQRAPNLNLSIRNDSWIVTSVGDSRRCISRDDRPWQSWVQRKLGTYETGRWTHFVMRIKWSHQTDGILEIWKDGEKVLSQRTRTMFNDRKGPNMKIGIYKPSWSSRRTNTNQRSLYYGDLRVALGSNQFEAVSTMNGPTGGTPAAPQGLAVDVAPPAEVSPAPAQPVGEAEPEGDNCVRCEIVQDRSSLSILR
ncbi:heparin lyase I family protein [Ectothiorhodospiraceae bacterium 2226]|nr:heparin lyase I family protein [Ectothiorhodospiraceae bacterium 2226]